MSTTFRGLKYWGKLTRDAEGNREYDAVFHVDSDDVDDGPTSVLATPGLPQVGDVWAFGNDLDTFAYCTLATDVKQQADEKGVLYWLVTMRYSTRSQTQRCKDQQIEDPLEIPDRISGSFVKYQEEATLDRFGRPIVNSAWEQVRGPQVEFDATRAQIRVEQNVPDLQLDVITALIDHVNSDELWGLPARCVKFTNFSFDVKYQGQCYKYYTRVLEFDCNGDGFDKDLLDEGTKALHGVWGKATDTPPGRWKLKTIGGQPPNSANPAHFTRYKDRNGENTKVLLDGEGKPWDPSIEVVDTCTECPAGTDGNLGSAPRTWRYYAYDVGTQTRVNYNLTYQSGCTWVGGPDGEPINSLEYSALGDMWLFTDDTVSPSRSYLTTGSTWNCLGPNVMTRSPSSAGGPNSIVLYAQSDSEPGNIHVEKYQEGDLLLLGIPTEL